MITVYPRCRSIATAASKSRRTVSSCVSLPKRTPTHFTPFMRKGIDRYGARSAERSSRPHLMSHRWISSPVSVSHCRMSSASHLPDCGSASTEKPGKSAHLCSSEIAYLSSAYAASCASSKVPPGRPALSLLPVRQTPEFCRYWVIFKYTIFARIEQLFFFSLSEVFCLLFGVNMVFIWHSIYYMGFLWYHQRREDGHFQ